MAESNVMQKSVRVGAKMPTETYDARLSILEGHARKTETDIGTITQDMRSLLAMFQGLDKKIEALAASKGPGIGEMIRTVSSLATAGAILAALMIYIITSVMQGPFTTLSERQSVLKERTAKVDDMATELAITRERIQLIQQRLDSGEFLRGWQATVAYNKPGS